MTKVAFVFPGQGAQYVGMARELAETYPEARQALLEASEGCGLDLVGLCFEGPAESLNLTEYTQPAVLAASAAVLAAVRSNGMPAPAFTAGLSLGEYTALVASGALSLGEAAGIVRLRGRLMQEAVPAGEGGMAAIVGLSAPETRAACAELECAPANFNCPGQVVISGRAAAVREAGDRCLALGARKVVPLRVSAPFHSDLMRPVAPLLHAELLRARLCDAAVPVVANCVARPITTTADIIRCLTEQVYSPVYWEDSVRWMTTAGVSTFVEIGPGQALSGFIKRIAPHATVVSVENLASLDAALAVFDRPWAVAAGEE
jgi:[acyl-carrier-protein] S-malonyltransferase